MALGNDLTPADIAAVTGGNGNSSWNGDGSWWIIVLFLFAAMNGGWGGMFGGNNAGGAAPYILNNGTNADIQRGFDQSAIMGSLTALTTGQCNQTATLQNALSANQMGIMQGFNDIQSQISNTGYGALNALNSGVNTLQNTLMQNEMARQNCCCETKHAIADLKYTIATENCADRAALSDGVRDIIANQNASVQTILDRLCQQEIDAKNETISQLRTQINLQSLAASQNAQTAQIIANNAAQTSLLEAAIRAGAGTTPTTAAA